MRRLVSITAALALVALSCGGSAEETSVTSAPSSQSAVTTEPGVVDGTEVAATTGGTVASDDGGAVVEIPAGALAEDTVISITQLDPADWPESFADAEVIGDVYDLQPSGLTFTEPVTISLQITEADTGLEFDVEAPLALLVVVSDDGTWEAASDQVISREGDHLIQMGVIDHFSVISLVGGAVTVSFTPTYVQSWNGAVFQAELLISQKEEGGSERPTLHWEYTQIAKAAVAAEGRVLRAPETVLEWRCATVGEGRFGVELELKEGDFGQQLGEEFLTPEAVGALFLVPSTAIKGVTIPAILTGTALCRDKPASPPPGATITIPADFIPTDDSPAECGDTFTDTLVVVFEDGTTGTLAFEGEPEGRPFTVTDYIVVSAYEIDLGLGDGSFAYERFELDLFSGEGTVTFGVSPPEAGLTCGYTIDFGEHVSDEGLIEFDF